MRMHVSFRRWKGAAPPGAKELGADGDDLTTPPTGGAPASADDAALFAPHTNTAGFPARRVAVVYRGPAGAAELESALWLWDDATEGWYLAGTRLLAPNEITYFVIPSLAEPSTFYPNVGAGSLAARLVVPDAATPDGEYVFGLATEMGGTCACPEEPAPDPG